MDTTRSRIHLFMPKEDYVVVLGPVAETKAGSPPITSSGLHPSAAVRRFLNATNEMAQPIEATAEDDLAAVSTLGGSTISIARFSST